MPRNWKKIKSASSYLRLTDQLYMILWLAVDREMLSGHLGGFIRRICWGEHLHFNRKGRKNVHAWTLGNLWVNWKIQHEIDNTLLLINCFDSAYSVINLGSSWLLLEELFLPMVTSRRFYVTMLERMGVGATWRRQNPETTFILILFTAPRLPLLPIN